MYITLILVQKDNSVLTNSSYNPHSPALSQ